jgi:GTP-binding protein
VDESQFRPSRRGTDERLDLSTRPAADERLAAKKSRREHEEFDGEWDDEAPDS